LLYKRELALNGPPDPDLPLSEEESHVQERLAEMADLMLRGLRVRMDKRPAGPISDAEAIMLLEGEITSDLNVLSGLLKDLRGELIGVGGVGGSRPA
jgi:hypothetical protein